MVAAPVPSRLSACLLAVLLGMLAGPAESLAAAEAEPKFLRIAAGPVAGPAFATAGIVAQALSAPAGGRPCDRGGACGVPGLIAMAQAVQEARDAAELLAVDRIDAALVPADIADALWGEGKGRSGMPATLRSVASLYTEDVHLFARADGPIQEASALKGSRVAIAADSLSRSSPLVRQLVDHLGAKTVRVTDLPTALKALDEGSVDAVAALLTAPALPLVEFAKYTPIRLLPLPVADVPAAFRTAIAPVTIAGGQYLGSGSIQTVGIPTQLLVSSTMSSDLAAALTASLWNAASAKIFLGGPPEARDIRLSNALAAMRIPLHPGAARYYRGLGALSDAVPVGE